MKKLIIYPWFLVFAVTALVGCSDNSSSPNPDAGEVQQASEKRQFVWNAMNYWYYWQKDVPQLADDHSYFNSDQDFQDYLMNFTNSDSLYAGLQYKDDRFSFFINDYEAYNNRNQGIYAATGLEYTIILFQNSDLVLGYIRYIVPDSPADEVGVKRGNLFTKVNGTTLSRTNFNMLLEGKDSYTLTLATINDKNNLEETGQTVTVQSRQVSEDPVFLHTVIDTSGTKIGYLVYNAFHSNTHQELNDVMGDFKAKGIDVLVLDLRYNGGGALITSQTLSSMISGRGSSDEFAELSFNDKRAATNDKTLNFFDEVPIADENGKFPTNAQDEITNTIPMNKLSINKIYVLTSFATASASEALINGLKPYMDVKLIGTTTTGKDEGSLTLYDAPAPYTEEKDANPDHKIALQPIVLQITNKNQNHYSDGFDPNYKVDEIDYLLAHHATLPPLGSPNDPLLGKAISEITGQPQTQERSRILPPDFQNRKILMDSQDLYPHQKEMYLLPNQVDKNTY